jgi:phage shock protein PspC (stress-responsive transcriptional regulator)
MTDEAAESRGPATTGAGSSPDAAAPSPSPTEPPPSSFDEPTAYTPPPPDGPPAGDPPPGSESVPPPWVGAAFTRDKLVRPAQGRYIAGVCAALGRATNTDPVLWRVILGVLSFFSGVGILIYLVGWLLIPSDGDSASPIESLLGRGTSGMQPLSVLLLSGASVLTFALVVSGGFRATLIAVAVVVGAGLLLMRNGWAGPNIRWNTPSGAPSSFPFGPGGPFAPKPEAAYAATAPPAPPASAATATAPPGEPATAPPPPQFAPPAGGYRPPFAPHGPWAGSQQVPFGATPPPLKPPKPPKPPRERSKLGRITFFAVLVVLGTLALISAAGASVPVSAYFAAALVTIALGLMVGAWFGRARGLIFLAVLATIGLAVSSGAERWGGQISSNVYRPRTVAAIADRYAFNVGDTTLDLRAVDFTGAQRNTTVAMKYGQVKVLLPDNVDTDVTLDMQRGRASLLGHEWSGKSIGTQEITDLGRDGAGGGTMHLTIQLNTGIVEVTR